MVKYHKVLERYYNHILPLRPFINVVKRQIKLGNCTNECLLSFDEMIKRGWTPKDINYYMKDFKFSTYDDSFGITFHDVWFDFEMVQKIEQANPDLLYRVTLTKLLSG